MQCRYCGASNAEEDHRCHRCGRRIHLASARPAPDSYPSASYPISHGSALPQRHPVAITGARPATQEPPAANVPRAPYQPSLFPREQGRVVPIQSYAPAQSRRTRVRTRTDGPGAEPKLSEAVAVAAPYQQQVFDWAPRRQATQEANRYCQAPVATPMHRAAAAVLDYSMVLIAVGLVVVMLHSAIGPDLINNRTLPWFGALAALFGLWYKLLWAIAGADSPGVRWTQLRTLTFDGGEPERNQRAVRVAAGWLSVLAGGLGLFWALADEETLSWHDHMSKTFLAPVGIREETD